MSLKFYLSLLTWPICCICECNSLWLVVDKMLHWMWALLLKWWNMRRLLLFTCSNHCMIIGTFNKVKVEFTRVRLNQYVDFHVLREWRTICCEWSYMSSWAFAIFLEPWFFDSWFLILYLIILWNMACWLKKNRCGFSLIFLFILADLQCIFFFYFSFHLITVVPIAKSQLRQVLPDPISG